MTKRTKARDYAMARLGAAISQIDDARTDAMGAMLGFVLPDEEDDARKELMDASLLSCHGAATSIQESIDGLTHMRDDELAMSEHEEAEIDSGEAQPEDE